MPENEENKDQFQDLSYGERRLKVKLYKGNNNLIQNQAERFIHMLNEVNEIREHGKHLVDEAAVINNRRIDHALDLIHDAYLVADDALRSRVQS